MVVAVGSIVLLALIVGSGVWLSAEAPEYVALPVAVAPEKPSVPGREPEETPSVLKPQLAPVEAPRQWLALDICPPVATCPTVAEAFLSEIPAPWDGEALDLRITHQGQVLNILLYNDGLTELRAGKTIVIREAVRAQEGTGTARLCASEQAQNCWIVPDNAVTIYNPTGVFQDGSALNIMLSGYVLPVQVRFVESQQNEMVGRGDMIR